MKQLKDFFKVENFFQPDTFFQKYSAELKFIAWLLTKGAQAVSIFLAIFYFKNHLSQSYYFEWIFNNAYPLIILISFLLAYCLEILSHIIYDLWSKFIVNVAMFKSIYSLLLFGLLCLGVFHVFPINKEISVKGGQHQFVDVIEVYTPQAATSILKEEEAEKRQKGRDLLSAENAIIADYQSKKQIVKDKHEPKIEQYRNGKLYNKGLTYHEGRLKVYENSGNATKIEYHKGWIRQRKKDIAKWENKMAKALRPIESAEQRALADNKLAYSKQRKTIEADFAIAKKDWKEKERIKMGKRDQQIEEAGVFTGWMGNGTAWIVLSLVFVFNFLCRGSEDEGLPEVVVNSLPYRYGSIFYVMVQFIFSIPLYALEWAIKEDLNGDGFTGRPREKKGKGILSYIRSRFQKKDTTPPEDEISDVEEIEDDILEPNIETEDQDEVVVLEEDSDEAQEILAEVEDTLERNGTPLPERLATQNLNVETNSPSASISIEFDMEPEKETVSPTVSEKETVSIPEKKIPETVITVANTFEGRGDEATNTRYQDYLEEKGKKIELDTADISDENKTEVTIPEVPVLAETNTVLTQPKTTNIIIMNPTKVGDTPKTEKNDDDLPTIKHTKPNQIVIQVGVRYVRDAIRRTVSRFGDDKVLAEKFHANIEYWTNSYEALLVKYLEKGLTVDLDEVNTFYKKCFITAKKRWEAEVKSRMDEYHLQKETNPNLEHPNTERLRAFEPNKDNAMALVYDMMERVEAKTNSTNSGEAVSKTA